MRGLDWTHERYVRLPTRNTTAWAMLGYEAQNLWMQMLRLMDRAGIIPLEPSALPFECIAAALPGSDPSHVERHLQTLLEREWLIYNEEMNCLVDPEFLDREEAAMSNAMRLRESRRTRRDKATRKRIMSEATQNASEPTQRDTARPPVPYRAVPCRTVPPEADSPELAADGDSRPTPRWISDDRWLCSCGTALPASTADHSHAGMTRGCGDLRPPATDPAVTVQRRGSSWVVHEEHGYLLGSFPESEQRWEWIYEPGMAESLIPATRFPTAAAAQEAFRQNRPETDSSEEVMPLDGPRAPDLHTDAEPPPAEPSEPAVEGRTEPNLEGEPDARQGVARQARRNPPAGRTGLATEGIDDGQGLPADDDFEDTELQDGPRGDRCGDHDTGGVPRAPIVVVWIPVKAGKMAAPAGVSVRPAPAGESRWETEAGVTAEKLAEYATTYELTEARTREEMRKARQWSIDNPGKRKTPRGFTSFLNRWMDGAVNGKGPRGPGGGYKPRSRYNMGRGGKEDEKGPRRNF